MKQELILPSFWIDDAPYDWSSLGEGEKMEFKKGDNLFLEGHKMTSIYLIVKGKVKLSINNRDGDEKTVGYLGTNSIVGTSSLFNSADYMFNATANSNCSLYKFNKENFINKMMEDKVIMQQVMKIMSMRIRILTNHALDLSFNHSYKRLAGALIEISNTYGKINKDGSIFIDFKITQKELSEIIGTTLVTVANHLKKLMDLNVIGKEKRNYIIYELEKLQEIAEGNEIEN